MQATGAFQAMGAEAVAAPGTGRGLLHVPMALRCATSWHQLAYVHVMHAAVQLWGTLRARL